MNDPGSLSGNYTLRLLRDSGNHLWVATWGGGMRKYIRENEQFEPYTHVESDSGSLAENIVYCISEVVSITGLNNPYNT